MSKLSAIHKQIAALQAEAERITKQEMSAAIAKVKSLMSEFGLTIEHLTQSVAGKPTAKKSKATKAKTASVAKYADPKTGKTWSGFGRAPSWIAGAKNRDDFLVGAVKATAKPVPVKKVGTKAAAPTTKRVKEKATAAAKPAVKRTTAPKTAAKKKPAAKAVTAKKAPTQKAKAAPVAKKAAPRKAPVGASTQMPAELPATAA